MKYKAWHKDWSSGIYNISYLEPPVTMRFVGILLCASVLYLEIKGFLIGIILWLGIVNFHYMSDGRNFAMWTGWSDMYDMGWFIVCGYWMRGWNCEIMGYSVW